MIYAIISNPVSGTTTIDQKRNALEAPAGILGAGIHGLDTRSPDDLMACVRDLAANCDVIVIAGGDGTFSDIINAVDTAQKPVAFLPLGTGNALRHAFKYRVIWVTLPDASKRPAFESMISSIAGIENGLSWHRSGLTAWFSSCGINMPGEE